MPARRELTMRQLRQMLRLHHDGVSAREIGRRLGLRRRRAPGTAEKPRDKAKVKAGVRFVQTYILGRLRNQTFFSLAECNAAIKGVLDRMNDRPMRRPQHSPSPRVPGTLRRAASLPHTKTLIPGGKHDYLFIEGTRL